MTLTIRTIDGRTPIPMGPRCRPLSTQHWKRFVMPRVRIFAATVFVVVPAMVMCALSPTLLAQSPGRHELPPGIFGDSAMQDGSVAGFRTREGRVAVGPASQAGSTTLRKLPVPAAQAKTLATKLSLQFRDVPGVSITPDVNSGELIVMAPPMIQFEITEALGTLAEATPAADQVRLSLRNASATQIEALLAGMSERPLATTTRSSGSLVVVNLAAAGLPATSIEIDRGRGEVVIHAPGDEMAGWRRAFNFIDQKSILAGQSIRMVRITQSGPAPIQRAVRLLGASGRSPEPSRAAVKRGLRVPVQTAGFGQDGGGTGGGSGNEGAGREGGGNEAAPGQEDAVGSGLFEGVEIEFVPEIGQAIIKGPQKDIDRVTEIIKQIQVQSEVTKPDVEVIVLKHVGSVALADLLRQIYDDVLSARQGQVSVTPLDTPNALLLIGRAEAIGGVMDLIKKLDQPSDDTARLRVYRLRNASALDAETNIRAFFVNRPGDDDDDRPGLGTRVRIQADYRTNSLIVQASPRDLDEVSKLIQELDALDLPAESQLRVITLSNASADELAEVIQQAIAGDAEANENATTPSSTLSILSVDADAGELLQSGVLLGAVVTADPNSNSLVIRAPATSMSLIVELVRQLDQAPNVESLVKVFTIENGDAVQLTTSLQTLFGENAETQGTSVGAANLAGLQPSTASESSLVPLRFSPDQRTNSIIASGSAEDLEVVESILLRLDTAGFAERITEVVWLRHQVAENISNALAAYVQQRAQTVNSIQQFQQGLGPYDLADRDLIVVSEPATNSLLISVTPRLYEDVRRLIDQLDRRPPMVMIKVVIAEVSLSDGFELGGEFGLQDSLLFSRSIVNDAIVSPAATPVDSGFLFNANGTPNTNAFGQESAAGRGLSTFGLGTVSDEFGYGGFVLSAASESISLLFRSLRDINRLQILSRPQVMTLDNNEALVQVGRTVARVTGVQNTEVGSQVITEDVQVGLILRVLPRVGSDGLIIMNIDATRSESDDLNGTPIPLDTGGFVVVEDIIQTTAQSVVAAYSGQTVVFGGLIQKSRDNISRRIPYLADIPWLGTMFRFDRETESRSELLVVMTPQLVTGEEDLEYVKQVESSRMSWCLADVVEMHGDVGLSGGYGLWGPAIGGTIYPDVQPTVDSFETTGAMAYPPGSVGEGSPHALGYPSQGPDWGASTFEPGAATPASPPLGDEMRIESILPPAAPAELVPPAIGTPAVPIAPLGANRPASRWNVSAAKYRQSIASGTTPDHKPTTAAAPVDLGGLLSSD